MGDVRSLDEARVKRSAHFDDEAYCSACEHRWRAVAPVGTTWLECPNCKTYRGLFQYAPHRGDLSRVCDSCNGFLFTVLERGKLECVRCATLLPGDYVNDDA